MTSSNPAPIAGDDHRQHIIVMRHGDRIDNFEPLWISTAAKPWDPPLVEDGKIRAFCTGRKIRLNTDFPIHRVFVSPFLRCLQTASEVITALCAVDDKPATMVRDQVSIDPSKIKVSVEFGLCEMLNRQAIRVNVEPKDGNWGFIKSDLESLLPAGTVDNTVEPVVEELPRWQETVTGARDRYVRVIKALADKYPSENLLLVTHGEGVGVAVSAFLKDTIVYDVEYCAYTHSRRSIHFDTDGSFTSGDFEVLTDECKTGITFLQSSNTDGIV